MKRRYLSAAPRAAALALLLAGLTAPPALAAVPSREPGQQDRAAGRQSRARSQLDLGLTQITPSVRSAKNTVTIKGQVTNRSGQVLDGLTLRLRFRGSRMISRGELAQYSATAVPVLPGVGPSEALGPVQNGATRQWTLTTTAATLQMSEFGVYPIAIEVINTATGGLLASKGTTLVFAGGVPAPKPTKVAWVWPVVDRPHRTTDSAFFDDKLEGSLSSGRLAGLVGAAAKSNVPLTWAIDPALLEDAQAMTDGYVLRGSRGGTAKDTKKPPSAAARRWLNDLRTVSGNEAYFAVPYADPDPVALVRARMNGNLRKAYDHMALTAGKNQMARPAELSVAWPPAGAADQATLDRMATLKSRTFLVNGQFLPSADPTVTPNATTTIKAGKSTQRAIGYDPTLNALVSGKIKTPGTVVLAQQRFLAETAMITAEAPNESRTLVIAPDRRWNPPAAFAQQLLKYTDDAGWLKPVSLKSVIAARPEVRTFSGYPSEYAKKELPTGYLRAVRTISGKASRFATIFDQQASAKERYERTVLRTESSFWRDSPTAAVRVRKTIDSEIDADIANIRVLRRKVGLAGSSGSMPVTVANDLTVGKVTVRIRVISKNEARLRIGTPDRDRLTLDPTEKDTVKVPLQFYANGDTEVVVELLTPDGKRIGEPTRISVRTTGYGRTALLITGGGLAVLFLGVGARVARAKRRNKAEGMSDGESAGEQPPAEEAAAAAGRAGGSGPDTAGTAGTASETRAAPPPVTTRWTTGPIGSDQSVRADGNADSPVPSTSGTDAGSTGNNPS